MKWRRFTIGMTCWVAGCGTAVLAESVPPASPTTAPAASSTAVGDAMAAQEPITLAAPFRSVLNGIELRPVAGGRTIEQPGSSEVARFLYPDRGWDVRLMTTPSSKPVPLTRSRDNANGAGMLELTVDQLTTADPHADVIEQDVKRLPEYDLATVVARHHVGTERELLQEAIVRLNDQNYYVLQFHAAEAAAGGSAQPDEGPSAGGGFGPVDEQAEVGARQAFTLMVGTIRLLDRTELLQEQRQRLYHTQALYDLMTQKHVEAALVPQRVMRVLRGGRDAGYIVELDRAATHADNDGVEVVLRSHVEVTQTASATVSTPVQGGQVVALPGASPAPASSAGAVIRVDRMSKMFVTFDRRHEDWSTTTRVDDGHLIAVGSAELGNSDKEVHEALDDSAVREHKQGDAQDPKQPPVRERAQYTLSVTDYTKSAAGVPIEKGLPPYYLPQALGQLLPRLLPLDHPSAYLFYSWVSDQHEVMARYVDVEGVQSVTLDGASLRAVVVKDRIGVDGPPTYHYLTRQGQWLGSTSPASDLVVLASDADTVRRMWPNADLGSPAAAAVNAAPVNPEPAPTTAAPAIP